MPDQLDATGLQVKTLTELVADLTAGMQAIYGSTINVDQNSPDGQMINIFAQSGEDLRQLLVQVYNSFNVDSAFGTILDERVALNGIARKGGTYTTTPVLITVDRALTLNGLNELILNPNAQIYTVKDGTGNRFQLITTQVFGGAGSATISFQAVDIGLVQVAANTIQSQVTTIVGVTAVNNPTIAGTVLGENEETDAEMKVRRIKSFMLAATGPADAIEAALLSIPLVTDAFVPENDTNAPANGVPAHGIWCIVEGGTDEEVGLAIYSKKIPGCAMAGSETYTVNRPNGTTVDIKFDRAVDQNLWVQFGLTPRNGTDTFDNDFVKAQLAAALTFKLNDKPNIGDVVVALLTIVPNAIATGIGVSDDGALFVDLVVPATFQEKFVLDVTRINIT